MDADADDTEDVCGYTYDHDLQLVDDRDGIRVSVCRECGAEIIEEEEDAGNA